MTDGDHEELLRLRDWRHEVVTPALAANREQLKQHEQRLAAMEPMLERMARADDIAEAVADRMHRTRWSRVTAGEKIGGIVVGALSAAALVSQWFH